MSKIIPYSENKNCNIHVTTGEFLCDMCNGWGRVTNQDGTLRTIFVQCPRCLGEGKLDWIENIVGKRKENKDGSWRPRSVDGIIFNVMDGKRIK